MQWLWFDYQIAPKKNENPLSYVGDFLEKVIYIAKDKFSIATVIFLLKYFEHIIIIYPATFVE